MLTARAAEEAALGTLLNRARERRGGALAITGDPGIGKSALLARGTALASDMLVMRAVGVEVESALAHATLHQLLAPVLDRADRLPEPQARALRVAFGLESGEPPDRFLVALGALTLLSEVASERPVLCLIDDVHWADPASVQALGFVARRLEAEPVAVLMAAREGEGEDLGALGVPELRLAGLPAAAAADLLDQRWGPRLVPVVRDRLVLACAGNPLALLEMPGALTGHQLAGRHPLPEPMVLPGELERVFRDRLRQQEPALRRLLLLAAASGSAPLGTVRAAAERLGLDVGQLDSAAAADLVEIEGLEIRFRHPLVRSAVYHEAGPAERRDAHRALAEALPAEGAEADRRAWHLAHAAVGPDEAVAGELEESGRRTLARSGPAVAAIAFEQAANLSTGDSHRARRLVLAAEAAWAGGDAVRAAALLDRVERLGAAAAEVRLDSQYLRALIELRAGVPRDALALLLPAARETVVDRPERAVAMLTALSEAAFQAQAEEAWEEVVRLAERIVGRVDGGGAMLARLVLAASRPPGERDGTAERDDLSRIEAADAPELQVRAAGFALSLGDHALARRLWAKGTARARALGAAGTLAWALQYVVLDELRRGRYASAEASADEGRRLALETGQPNVACLHEAALVELAALRGRAEEARELASGTLARATTNRLVGATVVTHRALAELALAEGSVETALEQLEALRALRLTEHRGMALYALADTVEAAVRIGRDDRREALVSDLAVAGTVRSPEAEAAVARSRALLSRGDEAMRHYAQAVHFYGAADLPLEQARTELLFGEFLRRERRRVEARPHLRIAVEMFERLGAPLWAERARTELRATGQTARRRDPSTLDQLTPQELRIVRAVAQGLTNREIGSQLFISPRTVDYHLRNVFGKLEISSRAELMRLALTSEDQLR